MGFLIWAASFLFWCFSPRSSLGKKAIFLYWIYGPVNLAYALLFKSSILDSLSNIEIIPTVIAIVIAYKFGETVVDKLNPNSGRLMYLLIGIGSSLILPVVINALFV
jgi:hypothetical protein